MSTQKQHAVYIPVHACERFRERVNGLKGPAKSNASIRAAIEEMYPKGLPFGGACGKDFMLLCEASVGEPGQEIILVCSKQEHGVRVKTVLAKDFAYANQSVLTRGRAKF